MEASAQELMRTLQLMALNAKERNSHGSNPTSHMTQEQINQQILHRSEEQYQQLAQMKSSKKKEFLDIPISGTNVPNLLPPLSKSKYSMDINSLKDITARKLEFKRNEGFYLKVQVIKKPWKFPGPASGINVILKDKNQDILRASFYNVINTEDWSKLEELFYMGREIVILHPFYKMAADGIVTIRVENRYEFFFYDEAPNKSIASSLDFVKLLEESKTLKDEANKLLKTNKNKALEKYHKSLDVFLKQKPRYALDQKDFFLEWKVHLQEQEKKQVLEHFSAVFSNCSLVFIEKEQPLLGLYYANFSSWCNPDFFKARLRKAKAQIDILHPHEALDYLESLKKIDAEKRFEGEIKQLTEEANKVIKEYSSGCMIADFLNNKLKNWNDQKSYIGPIMLQTTQQKGRGFVATRDISRGETLLIECGFIKNTTENSELTYNLLTHLEQREDLKPLYANLFPSHPSELPKYLKEEIRENLRETVIKMTFDAYRLKHPRTWTNFNEDEVSQMVMKTTLNVFGIAGRKALYPNLCLFNHSCAPNTSIWHQDNKILLLALEDIPKGSEVFVSYTSVLDDKEARKESLLNYGFECNCTRCLGKDGWSEKELQLTGIAKKESESAKTKVHDKLTQIHESIPTKKGVKIQDLEAFLKEVEKSYPQYYVFRASALYAFARYYALKSDEKMFFKYYDEIMKIIQFFPYHELRLILNSLLRDYFMGLGKELPVEKLKDLEYFGLPLEASLQLWEDFKESDGENWFLPMTTLL